MNRREFLKAVSAVSVCAAVPSFLPIAKIDGTIKSDSPFTPKNGFLISVQTSGHENEFLHLGMVICEDEVSSSPTILINDQPVENYNGLVEVGDAFQGTVVNGQTYFGVNLQIVYDEERFSAGVPTIRFI